MSEGGSEGEGGREEVSEGGREKRGARNNNERAEG